MRRLPSAVFPSAPDRSPDAVGGLGECPPPLLHIELAQQLDSLPKDLAVALLVLGSCGVVIPGPVPPGFSFVLLGTVAIRPSLLMHGGGCLARRFPKVFWVLIRFAPFPNGPGPALSRFGAGPRYLARP